MPWAPGGERDGHVWTPDLPGRQDEDIRRSGTLQGRTVDQLQGRQSNAERLSRRSAFLQDALRWPARLGFPARERRPPGLEGDRGTGQRKPSAHHRKQERNRSGPAGRNIALASIFISGALAAAKITVGLKANSTAVVSDGLESASDVLASSLVLFGLMMAAKPPDAEHPYGHGRLETLSGMAVGMILASMGALISVESMRRALIPHPAPA